MNRRDARVFSGQAVLGMLVIGGLAFFAALFFLGTGIGQGPLDNGRGHAAANGLNGFSALHALLEAQGHEVERNRNRGEIADNEGLLVLTPDLWSDGEELDEIVANRRYIGPTLVVLPKWFAFRMQADDGLGIREGWVSPVDADVAEWIEESRALGEPALAIGESEGAGTDWEGLGHAGALPRPDAVQSIAAARFNPLVRHPDGRVLAGYLDDGYYPELAAYADLDPGDEENTDAELWPVVVVAEPDLLNNWGLAEEERAMLALDLVDAALDGYELPVVFDLTLNGLGASKNLLTLAFAPPFLAATLCLLLAMIATGWRAWHRFGPPLAEAPAIAFGKEQLVANGAGLLQRSRRLHLLGPPYAALMSRRIAGLLGLPASGAPERREAAIAHLLAARRIAGGEAFPAALETLRAARSGHALLEAAGTLRSIERNLHP